MLSLVIAPSLVLVMKILSMIVIIGVAVAFGVLVNVWLFTRSRSWSAQRTIRRYLK